MPGHLSLSLLGMRKIYLLWWLLATAFPVSTFAKHIIGGVFTYECLGNGTYAFTLKMYRDCSDPTGAGFDFSAPISIYKGNSQTPITTLFLNPDQITPLEPEINDPCLILPPNICVQEGIYSFTYTFADWPSTESYHLSYQRCCRNATITNIVQPGDTGATFTVEIKPESQALCNNSPTFDNFPPIVICAGQPIDFHHAATDLEGDQLIYELCAPLKGGGTFGGNGCNGIAPNPACPPPYDAVDYFPPYTPLNPLGGNPPMTIDAVTGLLTGTPVLLGQYVVGVCVKEFRNGQLLSVIQRDFQFNVASCEPVVFAEIEEDSLLGQQNFLLQACADEDVEIVNLSNLNPALDIFYWEFLIDDSLYVFNELEPQIDFPGSGQYQGAFLINPGSICGDTARVTVEILPEIQSDFSFSYDTCRAGAVFFADQTEAGSEVVEWKWFFGDGEISEYPDPTHLYAGPGEYPATLLVTDSRDCQSAVTKAVRYFPVPALILVSPNDTVSCPPAVVRFSNLSSPVDDTYQVFWEFGDGGTSMDFSPEHQYDAPGIYSVRLEIVSPIGCVTDTTYTDLIEIQEPPVADFSYSPDYLSNLQPEVALTDASQYAYFRDWYHNGQPIGSKTEFVYMFPDTGLQQITLIATHYEGCRDTLSRWIDVTPEIRFFMPNAFTPNYDSLNDLFGPTGIFLGITGYRLQVWDRWGGLVFESDDPYQSWNGQQNNSGRLAPDGVYVYQVSFVGPRGAPEEHRGFITLMR